MKAIGRSGVGMPRDGERRPDAAGRTDPQPHGIRGPSPANPGDLRACASAIPMVSNDPRMVAALESYLEALRLGRPCAREELLAQHAEIADALNECLSVLEFIEMAAAPLGMSAADAESIAPKAQLGDYRIVREVGRGGMGVVYEAEQVSLGRRVALKVLPFAAAIDPKQRQRFQIEAQAAAQLHHPHIVPIFAVGCDRGIHYYAMQFVDGRSLAAIIHDLRTEQEAPAGAGAPSAGSAAASTEEASGSPADRPDDGPALTDSDEPAAIAPGLDAASPDASGSDLRHSAGHPSPPAGSPSPPPAAARLFHQDPDFCRNVARWGAEAADALDHAHGLGIVHRDIKPANLLIDHHGAVWITDFGLARFPGDLSLTGTGDLLGTVRYMSPEQALARRGVVDQRTDIYSLGVSLYELLTLRPAFNGRDHHELLNQIALDEPVPPRRLNPAIPRDLETIVLKAMAKDPSHRYATAQELSADLGRFLADEPILARRPGTAERVLRWSRRHRELVATAAVVVLLSLAISTSLIWAQARETRIQAGKTEAAAKKADEARNAYHAYMIESYPLIDKNAEQAINQALAQAQGRSGPANPEEAFQVFDQWLRILEQTSQLPGKDLESRIIIGRACTRLGYARTFFSMAKASPEGALEPKLLAQAAEDYRRAIARFEELLAASPGDARLRRYLADAVGVYGMGCCSRFAYRIGEAESCYRRAVELRRDLARGTGSGGANARAYTDESGEVNNFQRLVATVQILAGMEESAGRHAEADRLLRGLEEDVVALAARFPGPEFQRLRTRLCEPLMLGQSPVTPNGRRSMIQNCQSALVLDPEHAQAQNNLAWALVTAPEDSWFDPKRAQELAWKAVQRNPLNGESWNTLGVAAFRLRNWEKAAEALQKSNRISGGTGFDCFFLAMTRWQQGKRREAREWFDHGIAYIERTKSDDPELRRFHIEAAALLGLPGPRPEPGAGEAPKAATTIESKRPRDAGPGGSEPACREDRNYTMPGPGNRDRHAQDQGALAAQGSGDSTVDEAGTRCPVPHDDPE